MSKKGLEAEKDVREKLSKEFRTDFEKRKLDVGYRSNGNTITHEFDLVSEDGKVVGEVKSDKYTENHYKNTRLPRAFTACRYLEKVNAWKKLMIFTNREFYDHFKEDADGLIDQTIEIRYMELEE